MRAFPLSRYLLISFIFHAVLALIFIFGIEMTTPLAVFENTNQHDVISAVIVGDTAKSKILPHEVPKLKKNPAPSINKSNKASLPLPLPEKKINDAVPLAIKKEKKIVTKEMKPIFGKDLLADIQKETDKQKKKQEKILQKQFQKILQAQTEKSMRQQLLNEEITARGTEARFRAGEVNKYKALIIQSISQNWLVPLGTNKKLVCELMIRVSPGGQVLDVQLTKSSGDVALDRSAKAAVLKSSPLPVPKDAHEFAAFRQFVLKVKPENIL